MATRVAPARSGFLEVDGEPFYPIGARHVPVDADYPLLRSVGFNCVRWTAFGTDTNAVQAAELPTDLGGLMFYPYLYDRADLSADTARRAGDLRDLLEEVRNNDGLLCYEQRNEPATTFRRPSTPTGDPEGMRRGSDIIRRIDPHHPIRVGHMTGNTVAALKRYNPSVDIVGCNPYVICHPNMRPFVGCRPDGRIIDSPNQTLSAVGDYTTKMRRVAESRGVWMQIQAMPNENWFSETHTPENEGLGPYPHHVLPPNYWQLRFMSFHAVIRGAMGLEFAMHRVCTTDPGWIPVRRVIGLLARFSDLLCAPTVGGKLEIEYEDLGFSDWTGVEWLLKTGADGCYAITANTQFDPCVAYMSFAHSDDTEVLRDDGSWGPCEGRRGRIRLRYQPYEVKILRTARCS